MNCVPMEMDANIQALINISRKRMCHAADPITREYWWSLWREVYKYDQDIAWAMVPECIRCGSCPEYTSCGFFNAFAKNLTKEELADIHTRYDKYNELRAGRLKVEKDN